VPFHLVETSDLDGRFRLVKGSAKSLHFPAKVCT